MAREPSRIPSLDGWRAIAVMMVVAHHAGAVASRSGGEFEASPFWYLGVGVDVFFAISGFLITARILNEWEATGAVNLTNFYLRRAFRILPPANCVLLITVLLGVSGSAWNAISCLTFWRNYLPPGTGSWTTGHFWSLSLEEQFYLIWPCVLLLAGRARAPRVLFWSIMAVCAWRSLILLLWQSPAMMFRTDLRVDGLLWGCLAAFAFRRIRVPGWALAASIAAAAIISSNYRYGAGLVILPAAIAASVLATAQRPGSMIASALDWSPIAWIGRMSYSIYLWQQIFLTPAWQNPRANIDWPIPLRIAALFLIACASYYLIEKPCIQLGKRLIARRMRRSVFPGRECLTLRDLPAADASIPEQSEKVA
jgi:peptidoglycan/LPS O-acetylase OafA/YrhL